MFPIDYCTPQHSGVGYCNRCVYCYIWYFWLGCSATLNNGKQKNFFCRKQQIDADVLAVILQPSLKPSFFTQQNKTACLLISKLVRGVSTDVTVHTVFHSAHYAHRWEGIHCDISNIRPPCIVTSTCMYYIPRARTSSVIILLFCAVVYGLMMAAVYIAT